MRKIAIIAIIVIIAAFGIYFYSRSQNTNTTALDNAAANNADNSLSNISDTSGIGNVPDNSISNAPSQMPDNTVPANSSGTPPANTSGNASQPKTVTVSITSSGFDPQTVTINSGDSVKWVNNFSSPAHPASDPHPLHNGYPTTGGCISSTFDACSELPQGGSWTFQFDLTGTWGYHNHDNPGEKGTVIVK